MLDALYDCSPDGDVGDGTVSSQDVLQSVQGAVHVNLRVRVLAENHKNVSFPLLSRWNLWEKPRSRQTRFLSCIFFSIGRSYFIITVQ